MITSLRRHALVQRSDAQRPHRDRVRPVPTTRPRPPAPPAAPQRCGRRPDRLPGRRHQLRTHPALDRAPTRIVSGWTTSTELLLELGVGDGIVGRYNASSRNPSPAYADAEQQIPVIGESAPTKEALIAAHPDLIWADSDLFDGQQLPTIDQLAAEGIQVMILSRFCTDDATRATVRDVETDLDALGRILGIAARANQVKAGIETSSTLSPRRSAAPPRCRWR